MKAEIIVALLIAGALIEAMKLNEFLNNYENVCYKEELMCWNNDVVTSFMIVGKVLMPTTSTHRDYTACNNNHQYEEMQCTNSSWVKRKRKESKYKM